MGGEGVALAWDDGLGAGALWEPLTGAAVRLAGGAAPLALDG